MDLSKVFAAIDIKIASLQQARALLIGLDESHVALKPHRGRPKGSTNAAKAAKAVTAAKVVTMAKPATRGLSLEGRKRIAEGMKLRWPNKRKAMKPAKKEAPVKKEAVAAAK